MRNRWSATYVCFYLGAWLGRLSAGLPQKSHGISFSICVNAGRAAEYPQLGVR